MRPDGRVAPGGRSALRAALTGSPFWFCKAHSHKSVGRYRSAFARSASRSTAAAWIAGEHTNTPKSRGSCLLSASGWPNASLTSAPASRAINVAAAMSHSKPQRSVATRSARSSATIAIRSAIELGCSTATRSASSFGRVWVGTRAPANCVRVLARSGTSLSVAPWPASAIHSSPRAGAASIPISGRPPLTNATDTAQPLRPATKSRVPSIGSTSQIRSLCVRTLSSAVSSESHAADGSNRSNSRLRKRSTSRSASLTGLFGVLSQLDSA